MQERQDYARQNFDHLRRALLFEPRGHPDMWACLLTPPERAGSHFGAIFMHRSGYSPMSGHGIIALTTILLECGLAEMKAPETRLRLDTVAGMIRAYGEVVHDQVERVFFENVPSRVVASNLRLTVPEFGEISCDLAFGGALFAFVDAGKLGLVTSAGAVNSLIAAASKILPAMFKFCKLSSILPDENIQHSPIGCKRVY
jgi:trans-L-3-hydroxyproline dehydratase